MKTAISLLLITGMLFGIGACSQSASAEVLKSNESRITSPSVSSADMSTLVKGNSEFAFNLYQVLKSQDGNLFYSPFSISMALAMAYAGAEGATASQMANAMNFILPETSLNPAFNELDLELTSSGEGPEENVDRGFKLNIVNAIWGQKGYNFLQDYLDVLALNYGAGLRIVDFISSPEESRKTINDWVSEQTNEKITDLIPPGVLDTLTRMVLTNAIYFNGSWQYPFDTVDTSTGDFILLDGSSKSVPTMNQTTSFGFAKGDNYQAVELPYDGYELSMVIIQPDSGTFSSFEDNLDSGIVDGIIGEIGNRELNFTMPKFKYDSSFELNQALSTLGMKDAFIAGSADFSGMDGGHNLFIQNVLHKTYISVDENGTEAAAVTGVQIGTTSVPAEPLIVNIDSPFIYLIRDTGTGTILFIGRVTSP